MVKKKLHILFVEDIPSDAAMVDHELRKAGLSFETRRVETKSEFLHELAHHPPDLILSDHGLPSFDGIAALKLAKEKCPNVPFIFVTSSLDKDMAAKISEEGAPDCVPKEKLSRLAPAVRRALCRTKKKPSSRRSKKPKEEEGLDFVQPNLFKLTNRFPPKNSDSSNWSNSLPARYW
jgi:CheY-like chemotaxis protein